MAAVGYSRISLDRTGEGLGVERQSEDIRRLAEQRGWTLVELATDNDVSAAGKKTRPGFERVLSLVDDGSVQVVIAWALDRLTRNRRDTVRLIEACQRQGTTIALVRGSDLDMSTPAGRLTADLLAAVARSEIETKSDRQLRSNQQAVEKGMWNGGRRPFGYENDGTTIREDEAQAIRDAFRWVITGVSLSEAARRWNNRGFTTPQGARGTGASILWGQSNISRTLRNPRYVGLRTYRRKVTGKAAWPALVDEETFYAAQAVLGAPGRRPNRGDKRLLTGVALCGICDTPVWAGGGAPGRGIYRCRASQGHFSRKRQPVDDYVSDAVIARLRRPDAISMLRHPTDVTDVASLLRQSDDAMVKMDALAEAFAEGTISLSQLRKGTERLRSVIETVQAQIARSGRDMREILDIAAAPDVRAAWDSKSTEIRRHIIDSLMVVRLFPPGRGTRTLKVDTVRIEWKSDT